MPVLHAVHEEQQLLLVAQLPQAEQILRRRLQHASFGLDAFDQHGRGRGRNRPAHGVQVVERHMPEARNHGFKPLLDLVLAGGGDACQRPAVKGIQRCEDLEPAFLVAELAGELEQAFVGLAAAVAEKHLAGTDFVHQRLRQAALRLVIVEIRDVNQLARLLGQRFGDGRVRVPERGHRNAAAEVQVTLARHIKHPAPRAVAERDFKTRVTRHHVLLKQCLNRRQVIAHDRRRGWNNFFHGTKIFNLRFASPTRITSCGGS